MNQKKLNIVIMGSQGCGKGTQAKKLIEEYNLQHLETGAMLRKLAREDTKIGHIVDHIINKNGEFVPWSIVREVLDEAMDKMNPEKGIIFDGTPRRMEEVYYWDERFEDSPHWAFDFIFFIRLPEEESIKRLASRRVCTNEHPLIFGKDVHSETDACPFCGSSIHQREDDTPEKIRKRLSWSKEILEPVMQYYKERGMLTEIDGMGSIEDIFNRLKSHIEKIQ